MSARISRVLLFVAIGAACDDRARAPGTPGPARDGGAGGATDGAATEPDASAMPATCAPACPSGYACEDGVCVGAGPLVLDLRLVTVSGVVRLDGQTPQVGPSCAGATDTTMANVWFFGPSGASTARVTIPCSATDFAFHARLPVGRYRVAVSDDGASYSNLPIGQYTVIEELTLDAPRAGLTLALDTVTVSGRVRLDGAAPTPGPSCAGAPDATMANVWLTSAVGHTARVTIPCSATQFTFSARVPRGTYAVAVADDGASYSNLPIGLYTVEPTLDVSGPRTDLSLDVRTARLSGRLTVDGRAPTPGPSCAGVPDATMGNVWLDDLDGRAALRVTIPCSAADFSFAVRVPQGRYRVSVSDDGASYSDLPLGKFALAAPLEVTGDRAGVVLDLPTHAVSGSVRVDGATPQVGPSCQEASDTTMANVWWVDREHGHTARLRIPCSARQFTFAGRVAPGNYQVLVSDDGPTYSDLPTGMFEAVARREVSGDVSGLELALSTVTVRGVIRLDGQVPTVGPSCAGGSDTTMANVYFSDPAVRIPVTFRELLAAAPAVSARVRIPCSATQFDFTARLPAGDYRASVSDDGASYSNLPIGNYLALSRVRVR